MFEEITLTEENIAIGKLNTEIANISKKLYEILEKNHHIRLFSDDNHIDGYRIASSRPLQRFETNNIGEDIKRKNLDNRLFVSGDEDKENNTFNIICISKLDENNEYPYIKMSSKENFDSNIHFDLYITFYFPYWDDKFMNYMERQFDIELEKYEMLHNEIFKLKKKAKDLYGIDL